MESSPSVSKRQVELCVEESMKVQIIIELDVPTEDYSEEDINTGMLEQNVWDETMGALKATREIALLDCVHLSGAADNALHKAFADASIDHYKRWLKILEESIWKFKILY